jgi:hypothetical protein
MDPGKADAILEAMHDGTSLRKAAKAQRISPGTFLRWVDADPALAERYTRARARLLDVQAEELEAIGEAAAAAKSATKVAGLRLQSDNRKWLLARLAPQKYGERTHTELTGPDGGPLQTESTIDMSNLTPEQLRVLASIAVPTR